MESGEGQIELGEGFDWSAGQEARLREEKGIFLRSRALLETL
jgi:hypothetical protein